jgi:hypothetical protein
VRERLRTRTTGFEEEPMHVRKRLAATALAAVAAVGLSAAPASAATLPFGTVIAVQGLSVINTATSKSVKAICPAGQRVLGGGATLAPAGPHAVLTEAQPVHPSSGRDYFQVVASADQTGIVGAWGFTAYAFCATVPASFGLEIKSFTKPASSDATTQAGTQCSPGKFLIGVGGKIAGGAGQVDLGMFPNGNGQVAFGSAAFAKEDIDGYAGRYTVTGYSVCGTPNSVFGDFAMVRQTFQAPAFTPVLGSNINPPTCPAGMALTGLGAGASTPGTHMQTLAPNTINGPATLANFFAVATTPPASPWQMDVQAYCVG